MNEKKKKYIPLRLNILFFFVFLFFTALVLRLGVVQLVYGEDYTEQVNKTTDEAASINVPRGQIYDRNGNVVVGNTPLNAITYTKMRGTKPDELVDTAKKLAKIIDLTSEIEDVTERDMKDYWILTHKEEAKAKIPEAEDPNNELSDKELYALQLERITEKDLAAISEEEKEVVAIFRKFNSGYALEPQIVKNKGVTNEEFAVVSENLANLPNVDIATDWERNYLYGTTFRTVIGNITTSEEGLPSEKLNYYLARGYSRNDRVGKSQLEMQYEEILSGQKGKLINVTDKSGNLVKTEIISEGQAGKDLVLAIDMNLQEEVEKIIQEEILAARGRGAGKYLDKAFAVVMNPKTGEVLAMAGKQLVLEDGKNVFNDYALGTMNASFEVGSSVKGATVLTGLQTGAIKPGQVVMDQRLFIKGAQPKASWTNLGRIDDYDSLKRSSNVYMFNIAMSLMGVNYYPYVSLPNDPEVIQTLRNYFSQVGLGVKTGIDLPNETTGYQGDTIFELPGLVLDYTIGQYDTYTAMQLAQYVSTIANGGYRIKPQVVKEIRQPSVDNQLGAIYKPFEPVILNRLEVDPTYIERVQEGFRRVMQEPGGTGNLEFGSSPNRPAGKTGTAQSYTVYTDTDGVKKTTFTYNLTVVGYAPFEDPEVAFSVIVPSVSNDKDDINKYIGRRAMDKYFELKQVSSKSEETENKSENEDGVENGAE